MGARKYFQTTQGRIVAELRRRSHATATELAVGFDLSPNAVRQHLTVLVREGLVVERAARRGPTKPTIEYMLTSQADALFPQNYDRLLNAVLHEVRALHGDDGVQAVFTGLADRVKARHADSFTGPALRPRVDQLATFLRRQGVDVTVEETAEANIVITEHNCPYAQTVAEHPEVCGVVHQVLAHVAPQGYEQTSSLARGDRTCRFEIPHEGALSATAPSLTT